MSSDALRVLRLPITWVLGGMLVACGESSSPDPSPMTDASASPRDGGGDPLLSRDELMDPKACRGCHEGQYQEWAGSMHAYAAADPVFVAMNRRGQEETEGALGDFCVGCHAPMAVREGYTKDGLNLDDVPQELLGVGCYFCHSIDGVEGRHNALVSLAEDSVLRGPIGKPYPTPAHESTYASWLDGSHLDSAAACGACHDILTDKSVAAGDVALERTFAEWRDTLFNAQPEDGGLSCVGCHMPISTVRDKASNEPNAPRRLSKRHDFEGVDLAITPFIGAERQRILVERMLATTLLAEICVTTLGKIRVTLENVAGHAFPSGATQDRRAWLELKVFGADPEQPLYASGVVDDDQAVVDLEQPESELYDPDLVVLRDVPVDADGEPVHMFWDAAEIGSSNLIPGVRTVDVLDLDNYHIERRELFFAESATLGSDIQTVTLRVRIRPIGLDVIEDLIETGHLDASFRSKFQTMDLLPNRCYTEKQREAAPDVIHPSTTDCDSGDETTQYTLVWNATPSPGTSSRTTRIDEIPAQCVAHRTFYP